MKLLYSISFMYLLISMMHLTPTRLMDTLSATKKDFLKMKSFHQIKVAVLSDIIVHEIFVGKQEGMLVFASGKNACKHSPELLGMVQWLAVKKGYPRS